MYFYACMIYVHIYAHVNTHIYTQHKPVMEQCLQSLQRDKVWIQILCPRNNLPSKYKI